MPFNSGDRVHVPSLGTGIVREVRNNRRYLVEIKGRSMLVDETQLEPVEERKPRANAPPTQPAGELPTRAQAPTSLDLHGMTTEDAVVAFDAFLDAAILAGLAEVRVIHGKGGGRVKAAVHARLKQLPSIRSFLVDPRNPGVTIVTL